MLPFSELTSTGRTRRLKQFAEEVVVGHYGFSNPRVRLLSKHSFNTTFRVDVDGKRFVLRVGDACRIHSDGVENAEARWLAHLDDATTITAPRPIASIDGAWRVDHETSYVSERRACSMFTFLEGRELRAADPGATEMRNAGALLASLHEDAASTPLPSDEELGLHANRVVYFHEENLVRDFQSNHGSLFREALDRVQSHIDDLWKSPPHRPHQLHGDFGPHNVLIWRNQLRPIDFQDLQVGFDLQDLAITLSALHRTTPELASPFTEGYRSVRPLPEVSPSLLAALSAGRSLNMMNLGLHLRREGIDRFLDRHSNLVHKWMLTS